MKLPPHPLGQQLSFAARLVMQQANLINSQRPPQFAAATANRH
jgi:hypothetical protein